MSDFDAIVIHEGSHAADVSDWFKGGRVKDDRFSLYNSEFQAYEISSIYAEATGQLTKQFNIDAPEPYHRFLYRTTIWDSSWAPADKETLRSNGIDFLLSYDKNYLGGGKDKQILPNVRKR